VLTAVGGLLERERLSYADQLKLDRLLVVYQQTATSRNDEPLAALVATTQRKRKNMS
jgi:hypothetical protein